MEVFVSMENSVSVLTVGGHHTQKDLVSVLGHERCSRRGWVTDLSSPEKNLKMKLECDLTTFL